MLIKKSALWIEQHPGLLKCNTGEKRNGEEIKEVRMNVS